MVVVLLCFVFVLATSFEQPVSEISLVSCTLAVSLSVNYGWEPLVDSSLVDVSPASSFPVLCHCWFWFWEECLFYTVIHNYGNPYEKWNIFVARPHLWLQVGMVKPEIMLCETVLNLSTLNTLTYLRILTAWDEMDQPHYWCSNQTVAHTSSCMH